MKTVAELLQQLAETRAKDDRDWLDIQLALHRLIGRAS